MSGRSPLSAFAVCPSGLEPALLAELQALEGVSEAEAGRGGVSFRGSAEALARANLWCRIPTRILLLLDQVRLRGPDDLLEAARRIAWEKILSPNQTIRVDVNQGRQPSFALALNLAGLKVKDGLCDRLREHSGERPSVDTRAPDIRVWVFIDSDKATISVDTSGEPLFKRGWRIAKGEAPLRENLAAALMTMTHWTTQDPLLDPMCGSGTLLIEAVGQHAGLAPGFHPSMPRRFSCEHFAPGSVFSGVNFLALRQACARAWQQASSHTLPRVIGRDQDARLIQVARENAARALPPALCAQIQWETADFFNAAAPAPGPEGQGLLVCNPPYGKRLEMHVSDPTQDDAPRRMSEVLKRQYSGYTAWLLSDDLKLDSAMRLKASRRVPVFNGDLECRWMRFEMVVGSARHRERPREAQP